MAEEKLIGIPFDANEITLPDGSFGYDNILYAQDLADWFGAYFSNGVLVPNGLSLTTQLKVTMTDSTHVRVDHGMGSINGRTAFIDNPLTLAINKSTPDTEHWDRVVLELNLDENINSFRLLLVEGAYTTAPSYPALIRRPERYQLSLASLKVNTSGIYSLIDDRPSDDLCGISQTLIPIKPPEPIPGDTAANVKYTGNTGITGATVQEALDSVGTGFTAIDADITALEGAIGSANIPPVTATITSSSWAVDGGSYVTTVTSIPFVTGADSQSVFVDIEPTSSAQQSEWAKVWKIETLDKAIKLYASGQINTNLSIKIKAV